MDPKEWLQTLNRRMNADYDNIIVIDGEEGSGKSNTGLQIALGLNPTYDPENIIYNHSDWNNRSIYQKKQVLMIDEGGDLGFSRDWNVKANKELVKFMMIARQLNQTMIFCIPNMNWLDKYFREHRTRYRVHMIHRGLAVVQERVSDWRNNTVRFNDRFTFRPVNMKTTVPSLWNRYQERKKAALHDRGDATPPEDEAIGPIQINTD